VIYQWADSKYDVSTLGEEVTEDFLTLSEVQNEILLLRKRSYVLECCAAELNRKIQSSLSDEVLIKD